MDPVKMGKFIASLRRQANLTQEKLGEKIPDEEFRRKADENLLILSKSSSFSLEERKNYFKQKWRKEHIWLFILLGLILIATVVLPFLLNKPWGIGITPLTAVIEYGYQNNKMMAYVERHLYD